MGGWEGGGDETRRQGSKGGDGGGRDGSGVKVCGCVCVRGWGGGGRKEMESREVWEWQAVGQIRSHSVLNQE